MAQEYLIKDTSLTSIANAIRTKTGGTDTLTLDEMASELNAIPERTTSDLTASGATVTVPAGNYKSQVTKSISTGSAKTPATTITKNPTISVDASGKITASVSGTQNVTPTVTAGYVSSGTVGTITVSGSATQQLTTQAAKTITPTKSSQTAVASGVYTTGAVTVGAIPSEYITTTDATASADEIMSGETAYVNGSKVTGTFTIDSELSTQDDLISQIQTALQNKASGSAPVLQEKTVTPSTSSQTVTADSGYDGLSHVNVSGDANLVADNIKSGVSIFGVTGSYDGSSGAGGNVETCTVTIRVDAPTMGTETIWYTNGSSSVQNTVVPFFGESTTITVIKNSIIFVYGCNPECSGDATQLNTGMEKAIFIFGNALLTIK